MWQEAAGELLALRREDRPGWTSHEESRSRSDAQRPDVPEGAVQVLLTLHITHHCPPSLCLMMVSIALPEGL